MRVPRAVAQLLRVKECYTHKTNHVFNKMKKLKYLLLAAVAVVLAACGGNGAADQLAKKIASGESLTQSDYTEMINYCGDFASKAQVIQDKIDNLPTDSPEVTVLNTELDNLKTKFPLVNEFFGAIAKATPEQIGEDNVKKIDDLGTLTWFDAPSWATLTTDPEAAGFIEEMPSSDTTGVVAAPELEEKVVDKK